MLQKLRAWLLLPAQISAFEARYLDRMNRIGFVFFVLHVPAIMAVAAVNGTDPWLALQLTSAVLLGPLLAYLTFENPRALSMVYGFTAMLMGALLVHFGQGPVQVEMHFYFFALLAMLAVYANPMVIVTAALTVALHHLAVWAWLPSSLLNYAAPLWVVLVHAAFVVLESVATCFIARSFFDNVIGLEKIVQARTSQLDARNQDMRLVLDNVQQGFFTVDRDLFVSSERSRVVDTWLGPITPTTKLTDCLARHDAVVSERLRLGWDEVIADVMPLELTLAQLPSRFRSDARHFRLEYSPICVAGALEKVLVVVTDVTAEVERERLELEQRDVMQVLSRLGTDKSGVLEFFQEASQQVSTIVSQTPSDAVTQRRVIHTLKGNAMIFGVQTVARLCEQLETQLDEERTLPTEAQRAQLSERWTQLCESLELLLGERKRLHIEVEDGEYEDVLSAVLRGEPRSDIALKLKNWRLEPTIRRLARIGEQARALAQRTGKGAIKVDIQDHQLRLDSRTWAPFWSAFVHVIRNAVDHGLEPEAERAALGKGRATLGISTRIEGAELVIELRDDGRGIDWERVASKARENGLPHATREDLTEALFADGFSTAEVVTEYSGRGVGMSAARAACSERGGTLRVHSERGQGTRIAFRFPYVEEREIPVSPSLRVSA